MADRIVFDYDAMSASVANIKNIAAQYASAAQTLKSGIDSAISNWEGDSKNKFVQLFSTVYTYTHQDIPQMVTGLAELLEGNAKAMSDTDSEIAKNIPDSIMG